jgi:hypothetical protein
MLLPSPVGAATEGAPAVAVDIAINTARIEIPSFTMISRHCLNDRSLRGIENTLCDKSHTVEL